MLSLSSERRVYDSQYQKYLQTCYGNNYSNLMNPILSQNTNQSNNILVIPPTQSNNNTTANNANQNYLNHNGYYQPNTYYQQQSLIPQQKQPIFNNTNFSNQLTYYPNFTNVTIPNIIPQQNNNYYQQLDYQNLILKQKQRQEQEQEQNFKLNILPKNEFKHSFNTKNDAMFGSIIWKKSEDELLKYLRETKRMAWKKVALQFPGRTVNACQCRLKRLQKRNKV